MSYKDILKTEGRYRVKLIADEYANEPYDDSASPLMRIEPYTNRVTWADRGSGRPHDDDDYNIACAIERWGGPGSPLWTNVEKYLRAFYGVTEIETWHSGSHWYVTYDSQSWRDYTRAPEGSCSMTEYRAWCEGDVWSYTVEKNVTWTTDEPGFDDRATWETVESCGGYYGYNYALGEALMALAAVLEDEAKKERGE